MKKMHDLSQLLNSVQSQTPSTKNAQQLVNNRLMRSKQSTNKPYKKQVQQQPMTKSTYINPVKIVRESKIAQIDEQLLRLLKRMFLCKCKSLQIIFNSQKYAEFLQKFVNKNAHHTKHKIDLSDLNLLKCEQQLNQLIGFSQARDINLSKSVIRPSLLYLQNIERLCLNNCGLGNAELERLFDCLIERNKIVVLSLSSREVNNKNHLTRYDKLYELMRKCVTLTALYLSNCSIDRDNKIFEHIKGSSIRVIDLSYNQGVIGMSPFLEVLNLQGNRLTKPDAIFQKDIKHSTQLKSLNISHNEINQYELKTFLRHSYLDRLRQLQMNNIKIRQECECLQEFISYSNCLEKLSVVDCSLGQQSWMNVILGMKMNTSLREANLSKNPMHSKQVARAFGQMLVTSRLLKLNMSQCSISDQLGNLIFCHLGKNRHLQHMDISKNKFGNHTGMSLSLSLKTNHVLKVLKVRDNCVSYTIMKELMEYMSRNGYLVTKVLNKQRGELAEQYDVEKDLHQQLNKLNARLYQMHNDHALVQQNLQQVKTKYFNKKLTQSKKLIQQYQKKENQLIREMQYIQNLINSQQPIYDDPCETIV